MAASNDVMLVAGGWPSRQPNGTCVRAYRGGRLACVVVERKRRKAPWPQTVKASVMTAFRTYVAISQPVRSPVSNRMGIDRQRYIVVQTATNGL